MHAFKAIAQALFASPLVGSLAIMVLRDVLARRKAPQAPLLPTAGLRVSPGQPDLVQG